MQKQIILSVPSNLEYLATVENFVDILIQHFDVKDPELLSRQLRSTVNEAFVNILKHTPKSKDQLVTIYFELQKPSLLIRFPDEGKGMKINGYYPPYPKKLIGTDHLILTTLDGELRGYVENERSLKLWFKKNVRDMPLDDILQHISAGGMGLSIIVKFMDETRFILDENNRHCLEVRKSFKDVG